MIVVIVLVVLFTLLLAGYMVRASSAVSGGAVELEEPPTEAELLQARLDLHRVERGVDLTLAKHDQRREAEAMKQAIAEALDDKNGDGDGR